MEQTHSALIDRALSAHYGTGTPGDPTRATTDVVTHEGRLYVRLRHEDRLVDVYRVRTNGQLKRLRQIPSAVAA